MLAWARETGRIKLSDEGMTIKNSIEYIELAEIELDRAENSDASSTGHQQHLMRAQVYATLAVAKATFDKTRKKGR
jgi:hypothetical protein